MPQPTDDSRKDSSLQAVRDKYCWYAKNIRNACAGTLKARLTYINRLFSWIDPLNDAELFAKLTEKTITAFLLNYGVRYGPSSRENMHGAARSFLRFAYEERLIPNDLSFLVPAVRKRRMAVLPKALPTSVISDLEKSIDRSSPAGLRDSAIICLLSTYGVRGVQVRRLCLKDLDWEHDRIRFPAAKRGRQIEQHLTVKAGNLLADYIYKARPQSSLPEVFLMLNTADALTNPGGLSEVIRRRLLRAELTVPEGVSHGTHGFRHAFAMRMTGQVPFKDVVDMLGHRDPSSTLIYAKTDTQTLQQAALPWPGV